MGKFCVRCPSFRINSENEMICKFTNPPKKISFSSDGDLICPGEIRGLK